MHLNETMHTIFVRRGPISSLEAEVNEVLLNVIQEHANRLSAIAKVEVVQREPRVIAKRRMVKPINV